MEVEMIDGFTLLVLVLIGIGLTLLDHRTG